MESLSNKSACILDSGLFFGVPQRLARDFARVFYYSPIEIGGVAKADLAAYGLGFGCIERCDEPLSLLNTSHEPDLWIVPDITFLDLQNYLRSIGKRVWGSGAAADLELDRWQLKEFLAGHDMAVIESELVLGTDALQRLLEDTKDKYVKVSKYRGTMETYHHTNWQNSQIWHADLVRQLGPISTRLPFIVEGPINSAIEVGIDAIMIDGQILLPFMMGYEIKSKCYVGKVIHDEYELSPLLLHALRVVAGYYRGKQYRNWLSFECRITQDEQVYVTDLTCRMPNPAGGSQLEIYSNISNVIFDNADGQVITAPTPIAAYSAELVLASDYAQEHAIELRYPKNLDSRIKLLQPFRSGGSTFVLPTIYREKAIGTVIGMGSTPKAAIDDARRIADQIDSYDVEYDAGAITHALDTIKQGEALGLQF